MISWFIRICFNFSLLLGYCSIINRPLNDFYVKIFSIMKWNKLVKLMECTWILFRPCSFQNSLIKWYTWWVYEHWYSSKRLKKEWYTWINVFLNQTRGSDNCITKGQIRAGIDRFFQCSYSISNERYIFYFRASICSKPQRVFQAVFWFSNHRAWLIKWMLIACHTGQVTILMHIYWIFITLSNRSPKCT